MAQARKNGREAPNSADWAFATGGAITSGALNSVAFMGKAIPNPVFEFMTEAAQEAVEDYASTASSLFDGEAFANLPNNIKTYLGAGIIGGSTAVTIETPVKAAAFIANNSNVGTDTDTFADEFVGATGDTLADFEATATITSNLSPSVIADLEAAGVSPTSLSPTTIADLEATGEISSNLSSSTIADLEAAGVSPEILSAEGAVVEDAFADLEATGEIPAGETTTETIEDAFADLEATGEIPAGETGTETTGTDVIENLESEAADTPTGITGFTTAKGSTYELTSDSTTERTRAARDDTEESGLQPRSGKTVYMNENDKTTIGSIFQTEVPVQFVPDTTNNTAKLIHLDSYGPLNAGDDASETVNYSLTPEVGLYPVEIYDSNNSDIRNVHFGSEIVGLNTAEDAFVDLEATGRYPQVKQLQKQ